MHAVTFDATDAAGVADFVRDLLARFPALNVLVNNAAVIPASPVDEARRRAQTQFDVGRQLDEHLNTRCNRPQIGISEGCPLANFHFLSCCFEIWALLSDSNG